MKSFTVELDVINSGSPNDLAQNFSPAKGAASECYLCISSATTTATKLRVGDYENNDFINGNIKNGGTYKSFVNITDRNSKAKLIALPIDDPELLVNFSIYYGFRQFDALLSLAIQKALTAQFGPLMSALVTKLPSLIQDTAKNALSDEEKKLLTNFDNNLKSFVICTGFGKIGLIGNVNNPIVVPIYSVVDVDSAFIHLPIIKTGQLVANIILTPN